MPRKARDLLPSLLPLPPLPPIPLLRSRLPWSISRPLLLPPATLSSHRRGGVVTTPLILGPALAVSALGAVAGQASEHVSSWFGSGQAAASPTLPSTPAVPTRVAPVPGRAPTSGNPRRGQQVVVEGGRTPDHLEECQGYSVRPAGKVVSSLLRCAQHTRLT